MSQAAHRAPRAPALLLAVAVLVLLALVGDALVPAPEPAEPRPVSQSAPEAGMWYCPGAVGPEERATLSVAAVGERPSIITVERYPEGRPVADAPVQISPGDQYDLALAPGQAATPLRVRWLGGPAVASWRLEGGDAASANCAPAPTPRAHLAGFDTAGGARSFLHLFNPFSVDAVARVVFATPEGRQALLLTDNVLVPAGRTLRMSLNDFQPEQPVLGLTVEVLAGRLVALGEVNTSRGRALVEAVPEAAIEHAFAFGKTDGATTSWLELLNPGEQPAAVEIRVSDPAPELPSEEVSVPPGGVVRVDLDERSALSDYGVSVLGVNEVAVVVVRGTTVRTASGRQGFALSAAQTPAERLALVGGGTRARQARVSLYNPGAEAVTATVATAGGGLPEWSELVLPPNGRASVQLEAFSPERQSLAARVTASASIVAELRLVDTVGTLRLWTAPAVPERAWTGDGRRPPVRRDPALSGRPLPEPAG